MDATPASPSRKGRISVAPSEQFTPTMNGSACSTEIQNASDVWPERLRPLRSIAVNESHSGSSGATACAATIAAFAFKRVEDRLDEKEVDAAVAERADLLLVGGLHRVEGHGAECRVFDLRRERKRDVERADRACDEARLVRCSCGPSVGGGARKARSLEAHLRRGALERVVGLPDRRRGEGVRRCDVRARLEVRVVDLGDDLRRGEVQEIRVALDVVRVRGEPLAAVLLLAQPAAVDEHAPRPVENEDSLGEKLLELFFDVLHEIGSRLKGREPEGSRALGVW